MPMSVRSAKDFFRPLAVGAPEPLSEIPARPSRAIHFFDPSNEKMAAKVPGMVGTVDVLLGNLEDAVKADNKEAAREGLVAHRRRRPTSATPPSCGPGSTPWTAPGCSTTSPPWSPRSGDKLDVVMVPKVQGAEDIHYVDRLLAQLEAKAGLTGRSWCTRSWRPPAAWSNVEEICGASPRGCRASPWARPTSPRTAG